MTTPTPVRRVEGERTRAVVVGIRTADVDEAAFESSLAEIERLADTLGLRVLGRVTQRRPALAPAAALGEGKLEELAAFTGGPGHVPAYRAPGKGDEDEPETVANALPLEERAKVVVVDHDLTPSQMANLEKASGAEVLDRTMLILAIFQRHARSREAKMQVEIAHLAYMAPRLREAGAGQQRQRGGIGGKGAGESSLELDRRRIRDRIAELRREIDAAQKESDTRRSRRAETPTVALVGYTNAGKSSLMRALTGDAVYVADQLFATLDTTVRILLPETRPRILVSDTVGFIKKLPHDLVASFRSTLEEAREASLLLHVVDGSDAAFRDQLEVTRQVLADIGADTQPTLLVINKADRIPEEERAALAVEYPGAVIMSAHDPADVRGLHAHIVAFFERDMVEEEFFVPYASQRHVALLHERTRVLSEDYDESGATLRVRALPATLGSIRRAMQSA